VEVEISQRPDNVKGFQVEPKRWIVERTWTWLENARILTRDYERLPENEGMIYRDDSIDAAKTRPEQTNMEP